MENVEKKKTGKWEKKYGKALGKCGGKGKNKAGIVQGFPERILGKLELWIFGIHKNNNYSFEVEAGEARPENPVGGKKRRISGKFGGKNQKISVGEKWGEKKPEKSKYSPQKKPPMNPGRSQRWWNKSEFGRSGPISLPARVKGGDNWVWPHNLDF